AGPCTYSVAASNMPVGFFAGHGLGMIRGAKRLYFRVPEAVKDFVISTKGAGGETVRINLFNPDDKQVATAQTTPSSTSATVKVASGDHAGATWAVEVTKADQGAFEDNALTLSPNLPRIVSLHPSHVFGLAKK
ncbi:MAG: hypothetical protein GY851_11590, partial [bacterium]|nr:hypothetical protein [bacterium]